MEPTTEQFLDYVSYLTKDDDSNGKVKRGKVLKNAQVRVASENVPAHNATHKPHLTVYRSRGIVESIEIFCICGHQLKIDLMYADIHDVEPSEQE